MCCFVKPRTGNRKKTSPVKWISDCRQWGDDVFCRQSWLTRISYFRPSNVPLISVQKNADILWNRQSPMSINFLFYEFVCSPVIGSSFLLFSCRFFFGFTMRFHFIFFFLFRPLFFFLHYSLAAFWPAAKQKGQKNPFPCPDQRSIKPT